MCERIYRSTSGKTWMSFRGQWSLPYRARVRCSDGKYRNTSYLADQADTYFSIRASVRVKRKTVSGFIVGPGDGNGEYEFHAVKWGKNYKMLPNGMSVTERGMLAHAARSRQTAQLMHDHIEQMMREDGELDAGTCAGCAPVMYVTASDELLCAKCATQAWRDVRTPSEGKTPKAVETLPVAYVQLWEGKPVLCDGCDKLVKPRYCDPREDEDGIAV